MKKLLSIIISLACLTACNNQANKEKNIQNTKNKSMLVGSDDSSTGYTWSEVKGKKIRIFEDGIRLHSTTDAYSSFATYIVFNDDSSRVELFIQKEKPCILEKRKRLDGTSVWNVEDDATYRLKNVEMNGLFFVGNNYYTAQQEQKASFQ